MKHFLATVTLLIAAAGIAGVVSFRLASEPDVREALQKRDALAWLRTDFHLDEAQFAAIRKLHESYSKVCEKHCRAIQDAMTACDTLRAAASSDAKAIEAAERRVQELRVVCETAIAAHVRHVAAEMSPAEGQRYRALILPKIADFDHHAPPDVKLSSHGH